MFVCLFSVVRFRFGHYFSEAAGAVRISINIPLAWCVVWLQRTSIVIWGVPCMGNKKRFNTCAKWFQVRCASRSKNFWFFAIALPRSGQTSSSFPWRLIEFFQKTYILHTSVYYVKQRKNFLIVLWTSKSVSLEGRSALWTERQPSRIRQPLCQSELSFNSHERPRQNFSVEYQYIIKQKSDENKVKYHQGS